MKVWSTQTGAPTEIPEAQIPAALAPGGGYGVPAGTLIPLQTQDGELTQVPIEQFHEHPGATVVSPEAYEQHELQKTYGGAGQQALTAVEQGLGGATLGAAPALEGAIFGNQEQILGREHANPLTAAGSNVVGAVVPLLIPGAEEAGGVEEASALGTLGRAIGAPTRVASEISGSVGGAVKELLGASEADSWIASLAKHAAAEGASGATFGAISGAADHLTEEALGDPKANGESLLAATGHGALLGLGAGVGLGATGELGSQVLGRLAPHFARGAEEAAVRAVSPGAERLLSELPGGVRAAGRRMLDDGLVKSGETSEEIAAKLPGAADAAEKKAADILGAVDTEGRDFVPLKPILEDGEKLVAEMRATDHAAADKLEKQLIEVGKLGNVPDVWDAAQRGINRDAILNGASLKFSQAATLVDQVEGPLKGIVRRAFDDAGEKAAKRMGGSFAEAYDDATLAAKQYRALASAPPPAPGKGMNLTSAAFALFSGHPHAAVALTLGAAAKQYARARGFSTAAVVLDKLSVLRGIEQAAQRTNREIARGVDALVGTGKLADMKVGKVTHAAGVDAYEARVEAVQRAAKDPAGAAVIAAAPLAEHAPKAAAAFRAAAVRATNYLAAQIPKAPPRPSLTPHLEPKHVASLQERAKFNRQFDAVHDPKSVLHAAARGTVTPDMVEAASKTHPALWNGKIIPAVNAALADAKHPLTTQQRMSVATLKGVPTSDPVLARAYQQTFTDKSPPGGAPTQNQDQKHENKARYGNAPKRPITATAKNVALTVGRPQGT
jgi:hypothetical protein